MPVSNGGVDGQLRPSTTSAEKLVQQSDSGVDRSRVDSVKSIVVCNPTASAVKYSVYYDSDGETWDATTALFDDVSLPSNHTDVLAVGAILTDAAGSVGVKVETADTLVFTYFGTRT